jgi:hypothetical protein
LFLLLKEQLFCKNPHQLLTVPAQLLQLLLLAL